MGFSVVGSQEGRRAGRWGHCAPRLYHMWASPGWPRDVNWSDQTVLKTLVRYSTCSPEFGFSATGVFGTQKVGSLCPCTWCGDGIPGDLSSSSLHEFLRLTGGCSLWGLSCQHSPIRLTDTHSLLSSLLCASPSLTPWRDAVVKGHLVELNEREN